MTIMVKNENRRNPFLNQVIFETSGNRKKMARSRLGRRNPFLNQVIFEKMKNDTKMLVKVIGRNPFLNQVIFERLWKITSN